MVVADSRTPLSAQQAEDKKQRDAERSVKRAADAEEVKGVLADLRYLALFPSMATPEEVRSAATRAIRTLQRKNSKTIGLEVLEGLDVG
jgi:hypothetical protein